MGSQRVRTATSTRSPQSGPSPSCLRKPPRSWSQQGKGHSVRHCHCVDWGLCCPPGHQPGHILSWKTKARASEPSRHPLRGRHLGTLSSDILDLGKAALGPLPGSECYGGKAPGQKHVGVCMWLCHLNTTFWEERIQHICPGEPEAGRWLPEGVQSFFFREHLVFCSVTHARIL